MKRETALLLVVMAVVVLMLHVTQAPTASAGGPDWWSSDWKHRLKITIDSSKIDHDLVNFPVTVILDDSNFNFSHAMDNGDDIRFISESGSELAYERERHDAENEYAEYHVKIPSVSSSENTVFYMYFGNSGAPDGADPTSAWDDDFMAVWHLSEDPSGAAPQIHDSTSNRNDGTSSGDMTSEDQVEGKIDGCLDFDGSNDFIDCGNDTTLQVTDDFTVEAWAYWPGGGSIMGKWRTPDCGWALQQSGGKADFYLASHPGYTHLLSDDPLSEGWHYIVGVRESGTAYIYVDGVRQSNTTHQGVTESGTNLIIGSFNSSINRWHGKIDEIRIAAEPFSESWIKACYNSENGTLLSYGSETPVITSIATDSSLIDRDLDQISSGADDTVRITVQAQDNDSIADIDSSSGICFLTISDPDGTKLVDNLDISSTFSQISENEGKWFYDFNPDDNAICGPYDVELEVYDEVGSLDSEVNSQLFIVDDIKITADLNDYSPRTGQTITVSGTAKRVYGSGNLENVSVVDNHEGTMVVALTSDNSYSKSYTVTKLGGARANVRVRKSFSNLDGENGPLTYTAVNNPPLAPSLQSPDNNAVVLDNSKITFKWSFSDPDKNYGDHQSTYIVELSHDPDFSTIDLSSGWVNSSDNEWSVVLPAGVWYWRVKTKDLPGDASGYSSGRKFTFDAMPNKPFLISPADSYTTNDNIITFSWLFSDPDNGDSQSAYLVQIDDDPIFGSVNYTSGWIHSTTGSWTSPKLDEGIWYWRVATKDSFGVVGDYSSGRKLVIDRTAPIVVPRLNYGESYTNENKISVELAAYDALSDVVSMQLCNEEENWPENWDNYSQMTEFELPSGDGIKRVYYRVKDRAGNTADGVSSPIVLDTTPPIIGAISYRSWQAENGLLVALSCHVNDALSGIDPAHMRLYVDNNLVLHELRGSEVRHIGSFLPTFYNIELVVRDLAGNEDSENWELDLAPIDLPENVRGERVTALKVSKNSPASFSFENIDIMTIMIIPKENVPKLALTLFKLLNSPDGIPQHDGLPYGYFGIDLSPKIAALFRLEFRVSKAWMENENVTEVKLYRLHDSSWQEIGATFVGDDLQYRYYEAEVSDFSTLSIVGIKAPSIEGESPLLPLAALLAGVGTMGGGLWLYVRRQRKQLLDVIHRELHESPALREFKRSLGALVEQRVCELEAEIEMKKIGQKETKEKQETKNMDEEDFSALSKVFD